MSSWQLNLPRTCSLLILAFTLPGWAQPASPAHKTSAAFEPLEQWKAAVVAGNAATLKSFYSSNPPTKVGTTKGEFGPENDVAFWLDLKPRRMKLDIIQSQSPQPGVQQVAFEAEIQSRTGTAAHTVYVTAGQLWQQQGARWILVATKRNDLAHLKQPTSLDKNIYPPELDAHAEINRALQEAAKSGKRVILVFGANWCYDCHVLDLAFQRPDLSSVLEHNYEVVHVDVGQGEKNQDLMKKYNVPMAKGIPALAVLDGKGNLLYSQTGGEFEKARSLAPEDLLQFLNKWKPLAR